MFDLKAAANVNDPASLANRMRARRFALFEGLLDRLPKPVRIIDIGGTDAFWENRGWADRPGVDITAVNQECTPLRHSNLRTVQGDATDLSQYEDGAFDVAFSNSVIEHLFTWDRQVRMATEIRRVAKAYWVQTPNFWFPMEPHFHVPGWQWLPRSLRVALIRRHRFGWRGPCPDPATARAAVDEVRLVTAAEMQVLFRDAHLWHERIWGLSKSVVAYGGFGVRAEELTANAAPAPRISGRAAS